jgi:two-component system, OmpR family, phosphate regulon sensor histidine kinase PhoR
LTRKVFTKLLGLFVLLLAFHTLVMELVFRGMVERRAGEVLHRLGWEAFWSGLIALLVALPLAAWVAVRIMDRLQRVVDFARRIANGDLEARLPHSGSDELSEMETALNQTAERLGQSIRDIESARQELAAMLDSMQEAVVAVTAEGQVRWSNAVMQRMAGTQIREGCAGSRSAGLRPWSAGKRRSADGTRKFPFTGTSIRSECRSSAVGRSARRAARCDPH